MTSSLQSRPTGRSAFLAQLAIHRRPWGVARGNAASLGNATHHQRPQLSAVASQGRLITPVGRTTIRPLIVLEPHPWRGHGAEFAYREQHCWRLDLGAPAARCLGPAGSQAFCPYGRPDPQALLRAKIHPSHRLPKAAAHDLGGREPPGHPHNETGQPRPRLEPGRRVNKALDALVEAQGCRWRLCPWAALAARRRRQPLPETYEPQE